ncbi:hypothetical protein C8J56DRAFT_888935 [Mycena floridula]|nr:hypothetical protein C8J56DRAFT_888935 [Mycena floridula]
MCGIDSPQSSDVTDRDTTTRVFGQHRRDDDKASSHSHDTHKSKTSSSAGPSGVLGPTLPSTADLVLAREREEEERQAERSYKRKRDKAEDKGRWLDRERSVELDGSRRR